MMTETVRALAKAGSQKFVMTEPHCLKPTGLTAKPQVVNTQPLLITL